jgi:DNA processing protein
VRTLDRSDQDYPELLRLSPDPPARLWLDGAVEVLWAPQIAIVGARNASPQGLDNARLFARALAQAGFVVTSGLALGIDAAAHEAALKANGRSVAVVGTGLDEVYPRSNASLAAAIARTGTVVSEHPPGTPPRKGHFPRRNRIIAGLSVAVLVIEASERSGSLITARLAAEAGREVFAVPGSIHNPLARGCHLLIRQGAQLVMDIAEIVESARPLVEKMASGLRHRLNDGGPVESVVATPLSPQAQAVCAAIGHDASTLEQLLERTGLTVPVLSATLQSLELDGIIHVSSGAFVRARGP